MKEFLIAATKNDPSVKNILNDNQKVDFIINGGLPSRQITLGVENEFGISSGSGQNISVLSGSLSKDFIETGTNLGFKYVNSDLPGRQENITEFRVEQSLYKNFFGRDVRLKKESLIIEQEIIRLETLETYENYIKDISKQYLDYSQAFLDKNIAEKIYEGSIKLQNNVLEKNKKRIASQIDVDRANLLVLLKKESLINKTRNLESRLHKINRLISQNVNQYLPEVDFNISSNEVLTKLADNTEFFGFRTYRIINLKEEKSYKAVTLTQRLTDPKFNLFAGYDIENSKRFSTMVNQNQAVVGIKFEMPLWDTKSKAELMSTSLELQKIELLKKSTLLDLEKERNELVSQLRESNEKLALSKEKVEITKRILALEDKRYKYGKIELEKLIEIGNDFEEYQFKYHFDLINHNKLLVDFLALKDQLLDELF